MAESVEELCYHQPLNVMPFSEWIWGRTTAMMESEAGQQDRLSYEFNQGGKRKSFHAAENDGSWPWVEISANKNLAFN